MNLNTVIKVAVVLVLLAAVALLGTMAFQRYVKTRIEIGKAEALSNSLGMIGNTIQKVI